MKVQAFVVVAVLAILVGFGNGSSPLTFPDAYQTTGFIYLPYGDIYEHFDAWVNMKTGKSRQDTYNGTARIINRADEGNYGAMYKIVPMTTNTVTNQITCFKLEGSNEGSVVPQGVLPNASLYEYAMDMMYEGVKASVYISSFVNGNKVNNYTMLVAKDNGAPLVLHFVGYDRLFGSHYDEYDVIYKTFSSSAPDPSVFDFQEKYQCRGFPGPGVNDPMSENPFFEFVGAPSYSHDDKHKRVESEFKHFAEKHGKKYEDEKHLSQRKAIFNHNFRYISSVNRQNLSYKLGVNHMADYSDNELRRMRGVVKTKDSPKGTLYIPSSTEIPSSLNWRLRGAVTSVKDQGICGSCWSFGTTGTLEGSYFIKHQRLISLSEQSLVDCSWGYGNNGCDGGESERSYKWIMHYGCIPTEDSYGQYLMQDGYCHADEAKCGVRIKQWFNTQSGNVSALVAAIYNQGPISVGIDASHLSFAFYSYGVYFEPACGNKPDDLDHQVLAAGYGNQDGKDYIMVKNSWSTHWGMDGYILMSQRDNNCGIATDASFANVE